MNPTDIRNPIRKAEVIIENHIADAKEAKKSKKGTSKTGTETGKTKHKRGIGGKGWRGDKTWKNNVGRVNEGGTIEDLNGEVPTEQEATDLINESGGTVNKVDEPHEAPNPHNYPHINYTTSSGIKGTIKIQ